MALTKNSKIVTGTGTYWLAAGLHPGDIFSVDCVTEYEVATIDSNTQITLKTPYTGDSTTEIAYRIIRNFTASMSAETAANAANLLNNFRRYVDLDMQSIHGKSAYQIACDKGYVGTESEWVASLKGDSAYQVAVANGYTGTASEWLESLIGAGQYITLNERTQPLLSDWRNSILGSGNLGSTYDNNELFNTKNILLGQYYTMNGKKLWVAGFNYFRNNAIADYTKTVTFVGETDPQPWHTETDSNYPYTTYWESSWYNTYLPEYIAELEEFFGNRLLQFRMTAPSSYASAADWSPASAWSTFANKAHMICYSMCTGFSPYHSYAPLGYATTPQYHFYRQLPLFSMGRQYSTICADINNSTRLTIAESVDRVVQGGVTIDKANTSYAKLAVFHVKV